MITRLVDACRDRRLLGASIRWRTSQLELMFQLDSGPVTHAWCLARTSGKTSVAAAAVWNLTLRDDLDRLMPMGQIRYALVASPSEDQSRELLRVPRARIATQ